MSHGKGFTVIESLVALTLIGVGVAAWMATARLGVAVAADAERATRGAYNARNRAEHLASLPCAAVVGGASTTERWSVTEFANGMRLVEVVSPYGHGARAGLAEYAMLVAC